jgi:hypothetical protein
MGTRFKANVTSTPTTRRLGGFFVFAFVAVVLVATFGWSWVQAGDWKGSKTTVDGVTTMNNPATPMNKASSVKMEELWRLGGDTDDEDEFFGVISDIEIDEKGNVYLLDSQLSEVKIYTSDGEFMRSIGREGEGPGEFRRPASLFFNKEGNVGVIQTIPAKIVLLTPEGEPAGDHPLPVPEDQGFQLIRDGHAVGGELVLFMGRTQFEQGEGKWSRTDFLTRIDDQGKQLATYASKTNTIIMANAKLEDSKWDTIERRWTIDKNGKVYACESYDDYEINVWHPDGKLDKVIKREFKHRARDGEEKEFMGKLMGHFAQQMPGCEVIIADNCKDIEALYVRDDGSIWVINADGARDNPEGSLAVFDVYNNDGQFVKNVTLEGQGNSQEDLYLFVKNRLYVVTGFLQAAMVAQGVPDLYDEDDEPEPMAVICYKLEGDLLSAR